MPRKQRYRIRRLRDGTIRTYSAFSPRGAIKQILLDNGIRPLLEHGEEVEVKPVDEAGDWELYRVYR